MNLGGGGDTVQPITLTIPFQCPHSAPPPFIPYPTLPSSECSSFPRSPETIFAYLFMVHQLLPNGSLLSSGNTMQVQM